MFRRPLCMKVFVKVMAACRSTDVVVDCKDSDTLASIQQMVATETKIPVDAQTITRKGVALDSSKTLKELGIGADQTIHLTVDLEKAGSDVCNALVCGS